MALNGAVNGILLSGKITDISNNIIFLNTGRRFEIPGSLDKLTSQKLARIKKGQTVMVRLIPFVDQNEISNITKVIESNIIKYIECPNLKISFSARA